MLNPVNGRLSSGGVGARCRNNFSGSGVALRRGRRKRNLDVLQPPGERGGAVGRRLEWSTVESVRRPAAIRNRNG